MAIAPAESIKTYEKHYIGGKWVAPKSSETMDVLSASTEEVIGRIPLGNAADVDDAVLAARAAFETWGFTEPAERAAYLKKITAGLARTIRSICFCRSMVQATATAR